MHTLPPASRAYPGQQEVQTKPPSASPDGAQLAQLGIAGQLYPQRLEREDVGGVGGVGAGATGTGDVALGSVLGIRCSIVANELGTPPS